jgi:hypothetical protein
MTKYAELLPLVPNRGVQYRSGMDVTPVVWVGISEDGEYLISAEYDDGNERNPGGESVPTLALEPMCITMHYSHGMTIDVFPSGNFSVNFPRVNARGDLVQNSTLIESGRPWLNA